jgi:hypothetical protein
MARNRVIYQSEALYVADGTLIPTATHPSGNIKQIHRVQTANYGFTLNRQDVNQFGNLARIDQIALEAPTVDLDFSYYLTSGAQNEKNLGFTVGTNTANPGQFISGQTVPGNEATSQITVASGRNFFILTVGENLDANGSASTVWMAGGDSRTIGIGNGYITNYTVEAAVGALPTATVTVEGLNIRLCSGASGAQAIVPGVISDTAAASANLFVLPAPESGSLGSVTALRPGDLSVIISDDSLLTDLPTSAQSQGTYTNTAAHIQNMSIEVPLARTTLERLGSNYGFTKVVDYPFDITVNMSATLADLKTGGAGAAMTDILASESPKKLSFIFKAPGTDTNRLVYEVRGAKLLSENFSSTIGDNKSVDIVFTSQVGAANDTANGLFVFTTGAAYTP